MDGCAAPLITLDQLKTLATVWLPWIVTAASAICMFTPTPDPNTRLGKLYRVLETVALLVGKAKQSGLIPPAPVKAEQLLELARTLEPKKAL